MPASGSPITPATSSPRWYGKIDHTQKHTALDYAEEVGNPFAGTLTPTGNLTPTETRTPRTDRFPSTYLTATDQALPDASQAMPSTNFLDSQMWSWGNADPDDPKHATRLPTLILPPAGTPKLHPDYPLSADFTTAEMKTAMASQATHDTAAATFEGPSFCPTRELQMPRTGFCAQLGLLFVALCPLFIVPLFCTLAFIGLWIPAGHGHNNTSNAMHGLTVPPAVMVTQTQVFTQGETKATMLPATGVVESTEPVDDSAIFLFPSAVHPNGGLG
ncbi:hypothetical protein ACJ73_05638 [Blastomyces percursus]|uniref:Uncharacterized protein n=1 Tax=Blastomyces percursus TaxID=1658174 RepID=A0A1J9Q4I4_9EURO|nr:hypothetical protein ACJ73_05638 [Blastomyces percursus]